MLATKMTMMIIIWTRIKVRRVEGTGYSVNKHHLKSSKKIRYYLPPCAEKLREFFVNVAKI